MAGNRRNFLKQTGLGILGLPFIGDSFYHRLSYADSSVLPESGRTKSGKAKSVIQIWMWGGPSHLDTFDPKPGAGRDYCGTWDKPIATNVPGIEISQSLPMLAGCADLYAIVRGMTHGSFQHETASYLMQTGHQPGDGLVYPCLGAVVSKIKGHDAGYDLPVPPYVVLTTSQGRFSESGFLGTKYKPFVTGGDPNQSPFLVSGYVVEGMTEERQEHRRSLLNSLDIFGKVHHENQWVGEVGTARSNAYRLLQGDAVKIFNLDTEPEKIREEYGRNWFGQSCLTARRLVQKGVPYITINYRGWDTHKRHFETLGRRQAEWDRGLSTLLKELGHLGLLETTIVWWGGEFGRTPKIGWDSPWFGGRGHFGRCFNVVLAGGGFQGGRVVGVTDKTGENIVSRPVYPQDLLGSIYQMLGIHPDSPMPNEKGIHVPMMPPASDMGRLTEIMG
ncbi:MAG: DUF1501 domain-containing protein [Planctomycetaceae bacterium]|jgi:hypothetical protein|nr:DUF1501 domain-containing protein [Planctomycetaceae bacterium]